MAKGVMALSLKKETKNRPAQLIAGVALETTVELISNKAAVIEGCEGIVEYNDSSVSINCRKISLTFEGIDINLKALSSDIVEVSGSFTAITFSAR